MQTTVGPRIGAVREHFAALTEPAGFVPERATDTDGARTALFRDGAVIIEGVSPTGDALVRVAADVLGERLRRVYPVRTKTAEQADPLPLHRDGVSVAFHTRAGVLQWRDPDEDIVLVMCIQPAARGGESVVLDAYRLVDRIADDPTLNELARMLRSVELDPYGRNPGLSERGAHDVPRAARLVEHTRTGRRIVTASAYTSPLPRDPERDEHERHLEQWADVLATATAHAPRFLLRGGEVLVMDNYRMLHGHDAFVGRRTMSVLNVLSADAS